MRYQVVSRSVVKSTVAFPYNGCWRRSSRLPSRFYFHVSHAQTFHHLHVPGGTKVPVPAASCLPHPEI